MKNLLTKNLFFAVLLILSAMTLSACGNDQGSGSGAGAGAGTNGKDGKDDDTDTDGDNRPAATDADFEKLCKLRVKCDKDTAPNALRECIVLLKDTLYGAKRCNIQAMECMTRVRCSASLSEEQKKNEALKCVKECSIILKTPEGYTPKGTVGGLFCAVTITHARAYSDRVHSEKCAKEGYEALVNVGVDVSNVCEEDELNEYHQCLVGNTDPQHGMSENTIAKCKDKIKQQCMAKIESYVVPK